MIEVPAVATFLIDGLFITATVKFSKNYKTIDGYYPQISALVQGEKAIARAVAVGEKLDKSTRAKKFSAKSAMPRKERNRFSIRYPRADNYQTSFTKLAQIIRKIGWKWLIDMCSDPEGTNATAPFFYSAKHDAT